MNRAQAYKWANNPEKARSIVTSYDWSAASIKFRLAEAVLLDNFDRADSIVRQIGPNGEVGKLEYREWPLFHEYRKTERFLKIFREVFGESFYPAELESIKPDDISEKILLFEDSMRDQEMSQS